MEQGPPRSARGAHARRAILDAALGQFAAYGYRRASMEDLARAAGLSRPSLYFHFGSKEELFRALVQRLHDDQHAGAQAALERGGSRQDRVLAVLEASFVPFVELAAASPHGAELLDDGNRACADIILDGRRRTIVLLARLLDDPALDLGRHDLDPDAAAGLLVTCAHGAKDGPSDPDAYRERLRRLVAVVMAGLER